MATVKFTPLARNDLKEIRDFISLDKPGVASKYMAILKQKCELLANSPQLGIQRAEYCNLYKFPVDSYLIFYRPSQTGIEVIRVLHGNRDIDRILKSGY
ncbi:type II toxin-antitoxin system RelE/ParE family toxin [Methylomonas sp. AM2-LC]|uniref:type II toxin-antitoxin system RelE/ParE family toxin n=1 Tax=Methylomonas sp. AM2-LC TaxID=3153301 RepID=UPI0032641BE6